MNNWKKKWDVNYYFWIEIKFWRLILKLKIVIPLKNWVLSFNPVHVIVYHFKNVYQTSLEQNWGVFEQCLNFDLIFEFCGQQAWIQHHTCRGNNEWRKKLTVRESRQECGINCRPSKICWFPELVNFDTYPSFYISWIVDLTSLKAVAA